MLNIFIYDTSTENLVFQYGSPTSGCGLWLSSLLLEISSSFFLSSSSLSFSLLALSARIISSSCSFLLSISTLSLSSCSCLWSWREVMEAFVLFMGTAFFIVSSSSYSSSYPPWLSSCRRCCLRLSLRWVQSLKPSSSSREWELFGFRLLPYLWREDRQDHEIPNVISKIPTLGHIPFASSGSTQAFSVMCIIIKYNTAWDKLSNALLKPCCYYG